MDIEKAIPERTLVSVAGLAKLCRYLNSHGAEKTVVEVGAWTGLGTWVFARHFERVIAVDPWDPAQGEIAGEGQVADAERRFDERHARNPQVTKVRLPSLEAAALLAESRFDAVYIDALHAYDRVREDIEAWLPLVRPGGYLCGHDHHPERFPDVCRAVRRYFSPDRVVLFPDTSWAVRV